MLFVGRLNAQKGVSELLEALSWTPRNVTLDIVGDGEDAAALRARAKDLALGERVHWLGSVEREALPALYRRAAAVVIPSRQEGLGLVAVEAQLCKTPVIAYRSGGLPDVVRHEEGGVLVPTGDTRALADAMIQVVRDPAMAEGHGSSARAMMLDRFAPSKVAAGYRAMYQDLISGADQA
jgi:glycosyltransferase involved in cell wall biosynthesis